MSTSNHYVQGLNNDEAPADWPAIGDCEIALLANEFPQLEGTSAALWHSPRPMSAAAIVESAAERVFIKRHHRSVRTAATSAIHQSSAFCSTCAVAGCIRA